MLLHFYKYHGTGNDFILIDNRDKRFDNLNRNQIKVLCSRRFGIGADGLMLLKSHPDFDFEMAYYNADGSGGSMCGNGGRCITAFAKKLGIINANTKFLASDGPHDASIDENGLVKLKMIDVPVYEQQDEFSFINTGSPHYVKFVKNVAEVNVYESGKSIRYSEQFQKEGTNVNFVSAEQDGISVRTYERGVEDETY
ncbi:MAG: diaminopimelate epimerase, partial [Bacteroidales bacterium]|nr:diaminopimelate epimerase [Bacteroidales bacterium]